MNWYLVKLVFHIDNDVKDLHHFDEQLRLVHASSDGDAFLKARLIGKNEESNFDNHQSKKVHWRFIDVKELIFLGELKDGIEIYSETTETANKDWYIQSVLLRALKSTLALKTIQQ